MRVCMARTPRNRQDAERIAAWHARRVLRHNEAGERPMEFWHFMERVGFPARTRVNELEGYFPGIARLFDQIIHPEFYKKNKEQ